MANVTIPGLPDATALSATDLVIVEQTNNTTKTKIASIAAAAKSLQAYDGAATEATSHNGLTGTLNGGNLVMSARDEFLSTMGNSLTLGRTTPPLMAEILFTTASESTEYLIGVPALSSASDNVCRLPLSNIVGVPHFGYTGLPIPFEPAVPAGGAFYGVRYLGDIPITVNMHGTIDLFWRPTALSGVYDYPRLILNWSRSGDVTVQPEIQGRQELGVVMGSRMKATATPFKFVATEALDPINPTNSTDITSITWVPATFNINREITFIPGETYYLSLAYINLEGVTRNYVPYARVRIEQGALSFMMNLAPFVEKAYYGNS